MSAVIERRIEALEATARRTVAGSNSVLAGWVETLTPDECSFLLGALRRQQDRFEDDKRERLEVLLLRYQEFLRPKHTT